MQSVAPGRCGSQPCQPAPRTPGWASRRGPASSGQPHTCCRRADKGSHSEHRAERGERNEGCDGAHLDESQMSNCHAVLGYLNSVMCNCGLCWSGASGCFQLRVASRLMLLTIQYRSETCGGSRRVTHLSCTLSKSAGCEAIAQGCCRPCRGLSTGTQPAKLLCISNSAHLVVQDGGVAYTQPRHKCVAQEAAL